ncbi:MAG: phospholipase, partial [Spirochaetes bacterium]|nr:phospholipase [Spirochaetota bacterium]
MKKIIGKNKDLNYLLFLPDDYKNSTSGKHPLILFLHGSGEEGDDIEMVTINGIPQILNHIDEYSFLVLAPQCPKEKNWEDIADQLDGLLTEVVNEYGLAEDRLYLTGLSNGGTAVWHMGVLFPDRFSALVPISCNAPSLPGYPDKVIALKNIPIWAFHGEHDIVVPLREAKKTVKVLEM